jgi:hypothetical protein
MPFFDNKYTRGLKATGPFVLILLNILHIASYEALLNTDRNRTVSKIPIELACLPCSYIVNNLGPL